MIIHRIKYFSAQKKAIIELSSSSVKLLIGTEGNTNLRAFKTFSKRTVTTDGLRGGKMDIKWYSSKILPVIDEYVGICNSEGVDNIICIATAVYRDSKNCSEIFNLIKERTGIEPILLSGNEEAELSSKAYMKLNKGNQDWILFIDQGRGSTEFVLTNPRGRVNLVYSFPHGNADIRLLHESGIISLLDKSKIIQGIIGRSISMNARLVGGGGILTKNAGFRGGQFINLKKLEGEILCIYRYILEKIQNNKMQINPGDTSLGAFYVY